MTWRTLLLSAVASACVHAAERAIPVPGCDFSIAIPNDWVLTRPSEGAAFTAHSLPAADIALDAEARVRSQANVAISLVALADDTQAGLAYRSLQQLERLLSSFHPIDWDYDLVVGGRKWQRLHYTFVMGELIWEQELYITTSGKIAACIAFSSDQPHFEQWRSQFQHLLESMSASQAEIAH